MKWRTGFALALAGALVSCAHQEEAQPPPPPAPPSPQASCPGTTPGNGCLTLQFKVAPSIREKSTHPIRGALHWALYRSGDVGLFGPGNHKPLYGGTVDVDLSAPEATDDVSVPNLPPRKYKALAYVDVTSSNAGTAIAGDPVTVPHGAVDVASNEHAQTTVLFDFLR